jgi:ABC-type transport system substrate-binding protein
VQVLALNTKQEPLTDPRVRRALSAALNRTEVASVVSPVAQVTRTVMWLGSPYVNPSFRQPDQDLALADQLLTSAGWKRGSDGMRVNAEGKPLRITVVAPQQLQPSMTVIQSQWRKAGVDLDLRLMEWAAYVTMLQNPTNRPEAMAVGIFPAGCLRLTFPISSLEVTAQPLGIRECARGLSAGTPAHYARREGRRALMTRSGNCR